MVETRTDVMRLPKKLRRAGGPIFCAALCAVALSANANQKFISFDPQGSTATWAYGINVHGAIAGNYLDKNNFAHGYVRAQDGTYDIFDHDGVPVTVFGINDAGTVVGSYFDGSNNSGFLRTSDGNIVDIPCRLPFAINNNGVITGSGGVCDGGNGFVRAADGTITIFNPKDSSFTYPFAINLSGEIAGYYTDSARQTDRGFVRDPADGTITTFDAAHGATVTEVDCLNDAGTAAGKYRDKRNKWHGFLRAADGAITTYNSPKTFYGLYCGINNSDLIVSNYYDNYNTHGFLREAEGTIKTFDPPASTQTFPTSINAKGWIAGYYNDAGHPSTVHGFLLKGFQ